MLVNVVNHLRHLRVGTGRAGWAWEHVNISSLDSSTLSIVQGSANVGVDRTGRSVTTGNHKTVGLGHAGGGG